MGRGFPHLDLAESVARPEQTRCWGVLHFLSFPDAANLIKASTVVHVARLQCQAQGSFRKRCSEPTQRADGNCSSASADQVYGNNLPSSASSFLPLDIPTETIRRLPTSFVLIHLHHQVDGVSRKSIVFGTEVSVGLLRGQGVAKESEKAGKSWPQDSEKLGKHLLLF